jgi:hypothetical protein
MFILVIILLVIWTLAWKGMALWRSARRGEKIWFVIVLLVNTLGILEILYIYFFSKDTALEINRIPENNI